MEDERRKRSYKSVLLGKSIAEDGDAEPFKPVNEETSAVTELNKSLNSTNFLSFPSNGLGQSSREVDHQENMEFSGIDCHNNELKAYSGLELAHQMNRQKAQSSFLHVPTLNPCAFSHPQHCPSILQQLGQSSGPWLQIEEAGLSRENLNIMNGLRSWDIKQPCKDLPLYNAYSQLCQESFQNYEKNIPGALSSSGSTVICRTPYQCYSHSFPGSSSSHPFENAQNFFCQSLPRSELYAKFYDDVQWDFHNVGDRNVWGQCDTRGSRYDHTALQPQELDFLVGPTGHIYNMAKCQYGCRILQRKLIEGNASDVEKIFLEVVDHIAELMVDPFGNYLIQKLPEVCDVYQMRRIVSAITFKSGELVRASCNKHGSRVVQAIVKNTKDSAQAYVIISSLKPGMLNLVKDRYGHHVANHCLEYLSPSFAEYLFEDVIDHSFDLATTRHGCCIIKDCLNHFHGEVSCRLICEITYNAVILSQDPFGNYVVQRVIELNISPVMLQVLQQLEGSYGYLSTQKFSSNVVEKCIKYAGEEQRTPIIMELINDSHFEQIMRDQFGNFVVQTALSFSKGALHAALMDAIRPHIRRLKSSPFGRRVLSCYGFRKATLG